MSISLFSNIITIAVIIIPFNIPDRVSKWPHVSRTGGVYAVSQIDFDALSKQSAAKPSS